MSIFFFSDALMIASLGVTESDWRSLAVAALEKLDLNTAIKAFSRIKDLQHLELIYEFMVRKDNCLKIYRIYIIFNFTAFHLHRFVITSGE